ncbi:hypothetical protein [Desulfolucanica intricata]|uniref:hypothetical protein n=1 Tax=Desulfolucanica intricata TaxID=1285191 RepID=UPI00082F4BED|nr:hypothetical protein [Desulfolucanica intricata]
MSTVQRNISLQGNNSGSCPQQPGTILRIFIPAGAVINILNLIELSSPSGICLIVRLPILGGNSGLSGIFDAIKQAGGTIEVVES